MRKNSFDKTLTSRTDKYLINISDRVIYRGINGELAAEAWVKGITRTAKPVLDLEFSNGQSARRIPIAAVEIPAKAAQVPA